MLEASLQACREIQKGRVVDAIVKRECQCFGRFTQC